MKLQHNYQVVCFSYDQTSVSRINFRLMDKDTKSKQFDILVRNILQ